MPAAFSYLVTSGCWARCIYKAHNSWAVPASYLKIELLQRYSQSKLYFGLAWDTRQFSNWLSLNVLLSLLLPSKNVKKKKKKKARSPLLNCCSLTKVNSPHTKCISSEHCSQNISKLKTINIAAVSLKEYSMTDIISQNTDFFLSLILP